MSIFDSIKNAIFGGEAEAKEQDKPTTTTTTQAEQTASTSSSSSSVDVNAKLAAMASQKGEPLNYQTSIVDLLKVLDIDSSIVHRRELAKELGYDGDTDDSAKMNIWLHRTVMNKLAEDGGIIPDDWKN